MHTPSPTSDTRQQIIEAFEKFKEIFGYYPKVYVEHWRLGNKETQSNKGANPRSPYYCTDILNRYGCWVWVDGPGALANQRSEKFYDVLAVNGTPFSEFAQKRYGIIKGFVRTGKWKHADGDGFLQWYSKANIDSLEKERGLALVYTHLDRKWIDPKTRQTRESIKKAFEVPYIKRWVVCSCWSDS